MILVGVKGSVEARPVKRSEGSGQSGVRGVKRARRGQVSQWGLTQYGEERPSRQ